MIKHIIKNKETYIVGIIMAIVVLVYNNAIETKLAISLKNDKSGQIVLQNIGNNDIKITKIDALPYKANLIFFTQPNITNLSQYMQDEIKRAMNINNLLTIEDIEGSIISKNKEITRPLNSKPTKEGTFIAFDIPFEIHYEATSKWTNTILDLFKYIGLINPKKFIYIRFDGCSFSEIGKKAFDERELNQDRIIEKLQDCLKASKKFYARQQNIINNSKINSIKLQKHLNNIQNNQLLSDTKKVVKKISKLENGLKMNLCYTTGFYIEELQKRNILSAKLHNSFMNNCTIYK